MVSFNAVDEVKTEFDLTKESKLLAFLGIKVNQEEGEAGQGQNLLYHNLDFTVLTLPLSALPMLALLQHHQLGSSRTATLS
jgi:hypothetical protein